jgi:Flp pilus assembly protein TadD
MSYVRALAAAGQEETAGALLQRVADRFPEQSHLLIGWAEAMTRARDWPEAANRWLRVHELRPQDPQPVIEGARALIETGRLEEADALLAGAQATHPGNQTIAATWATVSMRRQLWPEAARRWERFRRDFAADAGWFEGGRDQRRDPMQRTRCWRKGANAFRTVRNCFAGGRGPAPSP